MFSGSILLAVALAVGWWVGSEKKPSVSRTAVASKAIHADAGGSETGGDEIVRENLRQPLRPRTKDTVPTAVLAVLSEGEQTVDERVRQLQGMRGVSLSEEEREVALGFLAGKNVPESMTRGSVNWLADELLTVLRLQEPPQEDLAAGLAQVAFPRETDPVVRDYIMQHLGHLWEQYGSRKEIDDALWRAVDSSDETTPGTALIALSRGYERDGREKKLEEVRQRAFELARNPATGLAVRVTALSIAGDGGGREVKELAAALAVNPESPVILKRVAEQAR